MSIIIRLSLIAMVTAAISCRENKPEKPNIAFILVDDLGWADLGSYGSTFYETANLDKLAEESVVFTNAYAAHPVCSPTRAALLTGRHPSRVNITDWIPGKNAKGKLLTPPEDADELALEEVTFPEILQKNGYKTFFAGKWHLGNEDYFPEQQGFDINIGGHHRGSPPGGYYSPYKNPKLSNGPNGEYLTDRLTNEAIQFVENNKQNPFLLYLSFYTVHTPIQAAKRHLDYYKKKLSGMDSTERKMKFREEHDGLTLLNQIRPDYASMVHAMDENIGRLLKKLKTEGLDDNTIIIFTSDNGGLSTLPQNRTPPTSVLPLRAGKGWCYEGGIRVPAIIKIPGSDFKGKVDVPIVSMDFFPTILSYAGIPEYPDLHIDGYNLKSLLQGKEELERKTLFWHYPHYHGSTWKPGAAIRQGQWKLIEFYHEQKTELYNLENDIGEQYDLSGKYPDKVQELKELLQMKQAETNSKLPIKNPGFINN